MGGYLLCVDGCASIAIQSSHLHNSYSRATLALLTPVKKER